MKLKAAYQALEADGFFAFTLFCSSRVKSVPARAAT
jgi:hypothetical protein